MNSKFEGVYIAPTATVIGDVEISPDSSVWFGAVIRGDVAAIKIGRRTSVQDNAVIHVSEGVGTVVGDDVTIGHSAAIHGCNIEDMILIGIGAIVLDNATVGTGSIIGAGAVVTEEMVVPPRSLVLGVPGRVIREVTSRQIEWIKNNAEQYVQLARRYVSLNTVDRSIL
ncbi:MAG TPA: gamma carbonic anhydrase family protein [Candidatus Acidoferrales bacterium]|nr:gamma carbonic anhydrase family protein [Candidatus Acidoferrales bacterium]